VSSRVTADFYSGLSDFIRTGDARGLDSLFESGIDPAVAAVYRNGFYRSCRQALASTYSSVQQWMGEDAFAGFARAYIARNPPRRGTLTGYGESFPDWLANNVDVADVWLVDMARLDWSWLSCLHGADCSALTPHTVHRLAQDGVDLAEYPIRLLGNACLVDTTSTAFARWRELKRKSEGGHSETQTLVKPSPQTALMWRPAMEVYARSLSHAEKIFLGELARGRDVTAASTVLLDAVLGFDLQSLFAQLLDSGVLQCAGKTPWQY
jgi:hypothetical protein